MPGLQHLFDKFAHSPMGDAQNGELVFHHPLTSMRLAITASSANVEQLANYGWVIAPGVTAPTFNTLTALRRAFPALRSQHPDELARVLDQHAVKALLEIQPEEHRGRLARWLMSRSQSTGDGELARWTIAACRDLPMKAGHPLAPSNESATYLASSAGVACVTGNELDGYTLFQRSLKTGRTRTTVSTTLDDLWFPNHEWGPAQWEAYEQLLISTPCTSRVFEQSAPDHIVAAATAPQHVLAQTIGLTAYLGAAADSVRRIFRHAPTSHWLDVASAETGISQRHARGIQLLVDLFMVEQLDDSSVIDFIVPAMRAEDSSFASMSDTQLLNVWRCAYDALLSSAPALKSSESMKYRAETLGTERRSTAESMRALLSDYYGKSAIQTLEASGKLNLVTNISELPSEMHDEILLSGAPVQPSAFYIDGQVYMIGDNIDPDRVCSTFLHEVGEHAALHNMLGRDYGRIVSGFNRLLSEGDTYALQAAMLVPASTAPANLSSEQLAYLIQLTAQDSDAREGGHDGFALGNRCLRDLRTWLYRTPLMRDLERQGELENFKLDPQDIAALAREAVDYFVAGTVVPSVDHNQWESRLDTQLLDALHGAKPQERVLTLNALPEALQMAYLYSLASLGSPYVYETLARMDEAVANASISTNPVTRALAGELTAITVRLSNRGLAASSLEATGLFASVSGTGNPDTSVLTLIREVDDGVWQAEHYTRGLGLTHKETFQNVEDAAQIIGHTHFAVHPSELDSVIANWGAVLAAEHGQLDSRAFTRWYEGSVAKHDDGSPMILYHGTGSNFSIPKGMFWASAATPAKPRQVTHSNGVLPVLESDIRVKGSVLADEYAEMRQDQSRYKNDNELDAEMALVMPVFLNVKRPFDADLFNAMHKGTVRIGDFRDALVAQAESSGRQVDIQMIGSLVKTLRLAARNEESGPYYRTNDFWQENHFAFGQAGHAAIRRLFAECGFDSVKFTEQGHLTYGVFDPSQVKSAIGNVGVFSSSPDIRFSFAGVKALSSSPSKLEVAKQMASDLQPPEVIWAQTGWMLGIDDEWRFEIDDSNARIRGFDFDKNEPEVTTTDPANYIDWAEEGMNSSSGVPLALVLDHPALYEAYPQMRNLRVKTFDRRPNEPTLGYFAHHARSFVRSKLFVATPWTLPAGSNLLSVILHETQHGIQQIEGFASGTIAESFESEVASSTPELKAQMLRYVEIDSSAAELACSPESYAEMSGYEPMIVERIKTWRAQGSWLGNVASFRRSLMTPYDLYFHEAGEVEARNTQSRSEMDATERARVFPLSTTDVDDALVRASRFISHAAHSAERESASFQQADSSLEWALKTNRWKDGLQDSALMLQAGESFNLFLVSDPTPANTQAGELYAVSLRGDVVGAFLFGRGNDSSMEVAAMVSPEHRRRGIASAAYDAVERFTGEPLARRPSGLSESASAFWSARQARLRTTKPPAPADTFAQWFGDSHTTLTNGRPKTFYHGSMAVFSKFDAARHRTILNNQFQGDAFHFIESPEVASTYAVAARNQLFRQHDVLEALKAVQPNPIGDLLMGFVQKGDLAWSDVSVDEFRQLQDLATASGFDLNDVREVASYVEWSACAVAHDDFNLFATSHNSDMPEEIKDIALVMGLGDAVPTPVVMPVFLKCTNTLYTNDRHQARQAKDQGFDSVCYSGEDTVAGVSEWMVFDAENIRSAFEFNKDAQILKPQQASSPRVMPLSPIAPPTDVGFDHWFEGSHCQNLFGEPRLVFAQTSFGTTYRTFGDLDTAAADAQGRITPAFLAIRTPFVVTNGPTITATDLVEKLGERKAAMIVGDLSRDGLLYVEDIIHSARGSKWLEQSGFDGAIFRDKSGSNKYVVLGDGQTVEGTVINRDLSGPVVWDPAPKPAPKNFSGERVNGRQFMLTNQNKPHGHVVPLDSADQYLTASDRLYVNWLNGQRITSTWITSTCNQTGTPDHLLDFLKQNRKALAGKSRIEDVFASHMAILRENIADARREGRREGSQSNHHLVIEDKLSNALAWAVDNSSRCKSTKGLVASDLLHWNKSLAEQSDLVREALSTLGIDGLYQVEREGVPLLKTSNRYNAEQSAAELPGATYRALDVNSLTGRACYEELANDLGGSKWASDVLVSMGVSGAQQGTSEVLLFKPEFNHRPHASMKMNEGMRTTPTDRAIQLTDIAGVIVDGGIGAACRSFEASQARALEVTESIIRMLSTREANRDLQIGSAVGDPEQTRSMLADARLLKKELMFMITPRHFLAWKEPMTEHQVKMLEPLIQLDHSHLLPGSAAVELLAGHHGMRRTLELLNGVGIIGAHAEKQTVCWAKGALKVFEVVHYDTPRIGSQAIGEQAGLAKNLMSLG